MRIQSLVFLSGGCLASVAGCSASSSTTTTSDGGMPWTISAADATQPADTGLGHPVLGNDASRGDDAPHLEAAAFADGTALPDGATLEAIHVDAAGHYSIAFARPDWTFSGSLGVAATQIANATGSDAVGPYHEVTFAYNDGTAKTGGLRAYDQIAAAVFTETYVAAAANETKPFPTFDAFPATPYHVSYSDTEFAPVSFNTLTADSPFVFFDDSANTFILSAASDFMNAATAQVSSGALSSGIDPAIASLPAGFSHQTVLVTDTGINTAYGTWGGILTSLSGKKRVANDATPYLEKFGYWTDNGAFYYYNYDTSVGYPGTLSSVRDYFTQLGVPLAYMQLDSWWYPKGSQQLWTDKADGQYTLTADPTVLPDGLAGFSTTMGMPLITHARWIDPSSPYRSEYTMSNNISTDPTYWAGIASYLSSSGVSVYEQDWLNQNALPQTTNLTDQNAFMDTMASAMAAKGLGVQYCMPLPRHYLQGSKYPNVTTTRVSVDRFSPPRYVDFLYVSLLTSSLGAWPWTDTFNSPETNNLLLSTLSAGMVGVGDQVGTSSASNLQQVVRPDGVIVKPDVPLVPIDQTFVNQAKGVNTPLVAATYTDFGAFRASYVYAFNVQSNATASFTPTELGYSGKVLVFDYFNRVGKVIDASATFTGQVGTNGAYYVVVPVGLSGIAFAGDQGKFVSVGKKRFPQVSDNGTLSVSVAFASGESNVILHGYAASQPTATASVGTVGSVSWSASTKLFTVTVSPASGATTATLTLK